MMRRALPLAAILTLLVVPSFAQNQKPVRTEELIYSLMSYNGRDYSPTFCRETVTTICLIADSDNFASIRTTLVYFWPTTGDWYTDSKALNVSHAGTLQITDRRGRVRPVDPVAYTYFSVQERYNQSWRVRLGPEADAEWERYSAMVEEYQAAMGAYGTAKATWDEAYAALATRIAALREQGKPVQAELDSLQGMRPPEEPREPSAYLVAPAPVRTGYVLRLPAGTYTARLVTPEGLVLEGSDKTVLAFGRRGSGMIGYDLIPSDRWSRSVESNTPTSVIYSTGGVDLYVRPFSQDEYNDLYYRKAIRNDAAGNPTVMKWIKVQQIEGASIEVTGRDGSALRVAEAPFFVEQSEGTGLGYSIVPFDPEGAHAGQEPTIRAFPIHLAPEAKTVRLRLYDAAGDLLPSGGRQIRIVRVPRFPYASLVVVLVPPVAGTLVLLRRRRKVGR